MSNEIDDALVEVKAATAWIGDEIDANAQSGYERYWMSPWSEIADLKKLIAEGAKLKGDVRLFEDYPPSEDHELDALRYEKIAREVTYREAAFRAVEDGED